jgi:benzylsuccinate CoA-transferase BbsF subunit
MTKKLLEGVKVVDFCRVIVGPLTTKTLADYGATVIRVESRKALGFFRTGGPEPDLSGHFTQWNTGKMGVTLDITNPKAVEVVKKLVAWADVVVENYAGGVMDRLGLGYEDLKKVKPDIIMLSSCMQGQTGPFAKHPGWGFQLSALSGFSNITGWPDRKPPEIGVYTDFITPHYNVMMILSALMHKKRTGEGQYIDSAQFETGVQFVMPLVLDYEVNKRISKRTGNKLDYAAPHNAYRCQDEYTWCGLPLFTEKGWTRFVESLAMRPLPCLKDERFATVEMRKKNAKELEECVEAWSINMTPEQVKMTIDRALTNEEKDNKEVVVERLRTGAYSPGENPVGTYRCKNEERWCAISVFTDEEWRGCCKVMGKPKLADDPKYSTLLARKENEEALDDIVNEWTKDKKAEDVMNLMQEAGVAAGLVETGEDQLENDPQTKHRNFFTELDHPRLGLHRVPGSAYIMSETPVQLTRAPLLGEHNEYVFKEFLGMTDEEIVDLVVSGALE